MGAGRGARWLGEGWQLFRAAPLGWLALSSVYLVGTNLLALVPLLGILIALVIVPPLTVGMMAAARATAAGGAPRIGLLAEGFRTETRSQLALGVVYLACSMLIFAASTAADSGGGLRAVLSSRDPSAEVEFRAVLFPLAVMALLYMPVLMMFWFAPPLAAWHGAAPAKALFFSFFACLMNWRAFLAYGAASALLVLALPLALLSVLMLLSFRVAAISLVFPLLIVLLPTLFASFYASYRDVFGAE